MSSSYPIYYAQLVANLLDAVEKLQFAAKEYTALDLGGETAKSLTADDFQSLSFTKDELVAAVSSIDALNTFLSAGHYTNLFKLFRPGG